MTTFAVAAVQPQLEVADNLDALARETAAAKRRFPWIDMIVFGELCAFGPRPETAQPLPGAAETHFCALARKHGVWLVPGSMYELDGAEIYNTAPVIDPSGRVVGRYRKMFPFLPYEQGVSAGSEGLVFDVPGVGRFGVSICYDTWFPETTRGLVWMGAEVILRPTMTNTIDRGAELAISRACAATNQCYVIDVNSAGRLGYGRSLVVGPEGDVLHEASAGGAECIPVVIDFERVRRTRRDGILGLGQPLKSFRDSRAEFPAYHPGARVSPSLEALGPLRMPKRPGPGEPESSEPPVLAPAAERRR